MTTKEKYLKVLDSMDSLMMKASLLSISFIKCDVPQVATECFEGMKEIALGYDEILRQIIKGAMDNDIRMGNRA